VQPVELGRSLACAIPGARFVPLEGDIHIMTMGDMEPMITAIEAFLPRRRAEATDAASEAEDRIPLTRREQQVLGLVAVGESNRQIVEELSSSINTADRHVSNILTKTGAANRAEAASFAVRHGRPDAGITGSC
jgi:DNA-binding NarL/FixJ family response regulator